MPLTKVIQNFIQCSQKLPSPNCIQWRYDPVIICDEQPVSWHMQNFKKIVAALQGVTRVVNISFVEPYLKTVRRVNNSSVIYRSIDPTRHKSVLKRYPDIIQLDDETGCSFVAELSSIAQDC